MKWLRSGGPPWACYVGRFELIFEPHAVRAFMKDTSKFVRVLTESPMTEQEQDWAVEVFSEVMEKYHEWLHPTPRPEPKRKSKRFTSPVKKEEPELVTLYAEDEDPETIEEALCMAHGATRLYAGLRVMELCDA